MLVPSSSTVGCPQINLTRGVLTINHALLTSDHESSQGSPVVTDPLQSNILPAYPRPADHPQRTGPSLAPFPIASSVNLVLTN